MLIAIHRESFQHMISGMDADSDADLVPVLSGSIASRAFRRIRAIVGRTSTEPPDASPHGSAEEKRSLSSGARRTTSASQGLKLKSNFSASEMSRSDVAYNPDVTAPQRMLLERAMTARATMKAWCDLRGISPMAFVTMPLPEPLQELQVARVAQWLGPMLMHAVRFGMRFGAAGKTHGESSGRNATEDARVQGRIGGVGSHSGLQDDSIGRLGCRWGFAGSGQRIVEGRR